MSEQWFKRNWADYNYPPDFEYCPLSEERVVRLLITSRSKVDRAHQLMMYSMTEDGLLTQGNPEMNEDILCTYIDLDRLIKECGMSDYQRWLIGEIMKGHSLKDIESDTGKKRGIIRSEFNNAVLQIVAENDRKFELYLSKKVL